MVAKIREFLEGAGFLNVAHNRLFPMTSRYVRQQSKRQMSDCFDGSVLRSSLTIH